MDVESVSDELYGLPLDEFTPTRRVREKQAKSGGDRDLAAQIHQLAKPNLVAWLANQLVRECADEIRPLLELGEELREATATLSGEQLRELSRQQRQLVSALVQRARRLADASGRTVSADTARGLEDTLRAALADRDGAEALAAGRLAEGMQNSGFGGHTGKVTHPVRSAEKSTTATESSRTTRQSTPQPKHAAPDVDQAKSAADEAITARQQAHDRLEGADRTVTEALGRVEQARRELTEALEAQSAAEKVQLRARSAFDRADRGARDARDAQRRLTEATEHLDRLAR